MFCGTILGMFTEKMTTYPMYTKLAIDYEDKGTVTSKRLGKPIPYIRFLLVYYKRNIFTQVYILARRTEILKKPVGMTEV